MKTIVAVLFALFAFTIALPHGDLLSTRFVGGLGKKGGFTIPTKGFTIPTKGFTIPTKGFTIPTKGIGLGINEALLASPLLINAGLGKSALLSPLLGLNTALLGTGINTALLGTGLNTALLGTGLNPLLIGTGISPFLGTMGMLGKKGGLII